MRLTIGEIHDLSIAIAGLEKDEKIKLTGETRLKLAINHNKLTPIASAYERARSRLLSDMVKKNRDSEAKQQISDAEIQADFADQNQGLRDASEEIELRKLTRPDLKLDENQNIGALTIARLMPIIEGIEPGEKA